MNDSVLTFCGLPFRITTIDHDAMIRQLAVLLRVIFVLLLLCNPAAAEDQAVEKDDKIAAIHERLSEKVLKSANSIDNFFSDERYYWTSNETRVTLRGNLDWIDDLGWTFDPELKLFLALPGLDKRLRLVANEPDKGGAVDSSPDDEDEPSIALRFMGQQSDAGGVSYDAGLSSENDEVQGFLQLNLFKHYSLGQRWVGRSEDRLYWYTSSGWRNDFRQYFETTIGRNFLFRSRTRIQYDEFKDNGWYPEQKFSLFQRFSDRAVLAYEAIAEQYWGGEPIFPDDERLVNDSRYTDFQLQLRWRQNVKYPWLFYEVWPVAAWLEERDYEFTPAVRLRLEIVLGNPPKKAILEE